MPAHSLPKDAHEQGGYKLSQGLEAIIDITQKASDAHNTPPAAHNPQHVRLASAVLRRMPAAWKPRGTSPSALLAKETNRWGPSASAEPIGPHRAIEIVRDTAITIGK